MIRTHRRGIATGIDECDVVPFFNRTQRHITRPDIEGLIDVAGKGDCLG